MERVRDEEHGGMMEISADVVVFPNFTMLDSISVRLMICEN